MRLQNSATRISSFPIQHIFTPYRTYYQFLKKIFSHDAYFFQHCGFSSNLTFSHFAHFCDFLSQPLVIPFKGLTIRIMCMSNLNFSETYRCIVYSALSTYFSCYFTFRLELAISLCKVNTKVVAARFAFYF